MGLFDFLKRKKKDTDNTPIQKKADESKISVSSFVEQNSQDVVPAEVRVKNAYPSRFGGLFPNEILVLDYAESFATQDNTYQRFWWSRYGIKNVDKILKLLLEKEFIEVGSIADILSKKTVADLKTVLEKYALPTKGKKAELIQRIQEQVPENDIIQLFPARPYVLTEKGKKELKAEEYVSYIHRNSVENLDIWSLNQMVYGNSSHIPYRDVIWGYLNKKSGEYFTAGDFGLYRNCRLRMATFLGEEGKVKGKLEMLAEVIYYDLTGMGNGYDTEFLYMKVPYLFPYEKSQAKTAPGVLKMVFDCQHQLGMTDNELKDLLRDKMKELYAPLQLFTVEECIDIIYYESTENTSQLEKLYEVAEKRFHKKYPNLKKNPFH